MLDFQMFKQYQVFTVVESGDSWEMSLKIRQVQIIHIGENSSAVLDYLDQRTPVLMKGLKLGRCAELWKDLHYLKSKVPIDCHVTCHVSTAACLDFRRKNFAYKTMPFHELLDKCSGLDDQKGIGREPTYFYMRALGKDQRKDVADFYTDFPGLRDDFTLPEQYFPAIISKYFSSVLRISSAGLQLWTHYDIMDNILVQVVGRKDVVLFDPLDADCLYLEGDKSAVLDVENADLTKFPKFSNATQYRCTLEESDVLFIPALWFHNTKALTPGIGLNYFWRHLPAEFYDSKDLYGNKDLIPVQRAFQSVDKVVKNLSCLPEPYKSFYAVRLINDIRNKFDLSVRVSSIN